MERNCFVVPKRLGWGLGVIYGCVFLILFVYAHVWTDPQFGFPIQRGGDSGKYFVLAQHLGTSGIFSFDREPPYHLEAFRSPGYPAFIALNSLYAPWFIPIIQIGLMLLVALMIFDISRSLMSHSAAVAASLLFAINPTTLFYSNVILSDCLFVFLEIGAFWLIYKWDSPRTTFLAFVVLGYAALVRPAGSYLALVYIAWICGKKLLNSQGKKVPLYILLAVLGVTVVVAPWMYRNYHTYKAAEISSIGPYTLLFFDMEEYYASKGIARQTINERWLSTLGASSRDEVYSPHFSQNISKIFLHEVIDHPDYIFFHVKGSFRFFVMSGISDVLTNFNNPRLILVHVVEWFERVLMLIFSLAMICAPFIAWKKDKHLNITLSACLALSIYMALVIGPIPNARYRLAALPFIFIPAVYSLEVLKKQIFDRQENSIQ